MMNQNEIIERSILKGLTGSSTLKVLQKEHPNSKLDEGDIKFVALQMSRAGYITDAVAQEYCQEVPRKPRILKTSSKPTRKDKVGAKAEPAPKRRGRPRRAKDVAEEAAQANKAKPAGQ